MLSSFRRRTARSPGAVRRLISFVAAFAVVASALVLTTSTPAAALNAPISGIASTPSRGGYWLVGRDGGVFSFGDAPFFGSMANYPLPAPVVGITGSPTGLGYWLVGSDGAVYAFGDAVNHGSMAGQPLSRAVVGIAATPTGRGYWLTSGDGGVFAFGDAAFRGNMVGQPLAQPVSGIAAHPTSGGYWLTAGDGGVFAFGAPFKGGMGGQPLNKPVVGIASSRTGNGYWLVGSDGGIYAFGDAPFRGSAGGTALAAPVVGMAQGPAGDGYWLAASDGGVFAYGSAPYLGNMVSSAPPSSGNTRPSNSALRTRIVSYAQEFVGYDTPSENKHNFTKQNDRDGVDEAHEYVTRRWCADFLSFVWIHSGVEGWPWTPQVDGFRRYSEKRGMFRDRNYTPRPGDVAIYKDAAREISHVNLVIEVRADGWVRTVGGNEGRSLDTVVRRGFHDIRSSREALVGFALPDDPAQPYHQEDTSAQQSDAQADTFMPQARVSDVTVTEGEVANFVVTLSHDVSYPVDVRVATADGTAVSVLDLDYKGLPVGGQDLRFAPGESTKTVAVATTQDTLLEFAESFSFEVTTTSPDAVEIVDGVAAGSIQDNDSL